VHVIGQIKKYFLGGWIVLIRNGTNLITIGLLGLLTLSLGLNPAFPECGVRRVGAITVE